MPTDRVSDVARTIGFLKAVDTLVWQMAASVIIPGRCAPCCCACVFYMFVTCDGQSTQRTCRHAAADPADSGVDAAATVQWQLPGAPE